MRDNEALRAVDVRKSFGHVEALQGASITVDRGEIVALFGDNGAGKSTFMKVILGIYAPTSGHIAVEGKPTQFSSIRDAQSQGVDAVHQQLSLPDDARVYEAMYLGHEILRPGLEGLLGVLDRKAMASGAVTALEGLGIALPSVHVRISDLSGGQRQVVAVARAQMWTKHLLLLDEPTAALSARQTDLICDSIRRVADRGLGVLLVSHDIPRTLELADRVYVLRHGRTVYESSAKDATVSSVLSAMVGGLAA